MPPKKRRRLVHNLCLGCNDFRYRKMDELVDHLLEKPSCVSDGRYWVCHCCRKYATNSHSNFLQHLHRSSNNNCARFFEQSQQAQGAIIPQPPDETNEFIQFDDDFVDDIQVDAHNKNHALTHVFQESGQSKHIQLVQFIRNKSTDQLGKPISTLHYSEDMERSNNIQTILLRQAASVSSKSTGTFGSVLQTLPGMGTASYVLHDDTLKALHTHGDMYDPNEEESDDSSQEDREISTDVLTDVDDHENEATRLIRIVNDSAITILTEERSFVNSGIEDEDSNNLNNAQNHMNAEALNSDDDSDGDEPGCPSYYTAKARNIFKQNIKNVLEGKEVQFPINYDSVGDPPNSRSEDARSTLDAIRNHREKDINFTPNDNCLLDLYEILQDSNAPMGLFDKIVDWTEDHKEAIGHGNLMKRKAATRLWTQKLGGGIYTPMPTTTKVKLTSGIETNISHFSLRNIILNTLADKELFQKKNLLIDPDNLRKVPGDENEMFGEPNTGSWYKKAIEHCCPTDKHMIWPIAFFIDGLKLDKFGKLSAEGILGCYQGFIRAIRNNKKAWFLSGFVEDQANFKDTTGYVQGRKMQDYHDMLKQVFAELKSIYDNGGLRVNIDFQDSKGLREDIIIVPVIQYIIGDCKGNDVLCGRKGTHHLGSPWLCRDCNCPSNQASNPTFQCRPISMNDIKNATEQELTDMSHYLIDNAFWDLPFGGCPLSIHGNSPAEFLHNVEMGKCKEIGRDLSFTVAANACISEVFVKLYPFAKCQSERDLPNLRPFRKGLSSVKCLKATETFDRIFAEWLALMNPSLQRKLRSFKKCGQADNNVKNSRESIQNFIRVLEETMMLHELLKLDEIPKEFVVPTDPDDQMTSRAHNFIVHYSERFKQHIVLDKNDFRTPKFHQLLHTVRTMLRVGVFKNVDGSIGEKMAKWLVKDLSRLTNKDRDILSLSICLRYAEKMVVETLLQIRDHSQRKTNKRSVLSNPIDITTVNPKTCGTTNKSFKLIRKNINIIPNAGQHVDQLSIETVWKKGTIPPITGFPDHLLLAVCNRLYNWNPIHGGKLSEDSIVEGFTDYSVVIDDRNVLFRANPHFRTQGEWFDWANFHWGDAEGTVPGRILMFLDFSNCTVVNAENEGDNDNQNNDNDDEDLILVGHPRHHLKNDKFALIQSAKASKASYDGDNSVLTDDHFQSNIAHWVELESEYRLVPLDAIESEVFVVDTVPCDDNNDEYDKTALVVYPRREWGKRIFQHDDDQ